MVSAIARAGVAVGEYTRLECSSQYRMVHEVFGMPRCVLSSLLG